MKVYVRVTQPHFNYTRVARNWKPHVLCSIAQKGKDHYNFFWTMFPFRIQLVKHSRASFELHRFFQVNCDVDLISSTLSERTVLMTDWLHLEKMAILLIGFRLKHSNNLCVVVIHWLQSPFDEALQWITLIIFQLQKSHQTINLKWNVIPC